MQVVLPPAQLLENCPEPDEPKDILQLLKDGKSDDAAVKYVRFILDVRDSFQLCNGRLREARQYCANMKQRLESNE